jgi:CRISPR system Cascade subunit CasE
MEERMSDLFLSRISLRDEPSVATLGAILLDTSGRHRIEASRRLVWTLFADRTDRKRDYLWREDSAGRFYLLSSRPPHDNHQLFTVETKEFQPALSPGDKLAFSLRANATISRPRGDTRRAGKRDDVVMAALNAVPSGERAAARKELVRRESLAWLRRQGVAAGFEFNEQNVRVDGYQPLTIRGDGNNALKLSVIELDGMLTVRDPNIFLGKLARGFGRGKAFGLGLMLIRRRSA